MAILNVIIPSYNHERYISQCIEALLSITTIDLDITVVDDLSRDNTALVVEHIISSYTGSHKLKLVKKKENRGVVDSLNYAVKSIDNDGYVYLIASDDVVNPEGVERAVKVMQEKKYRFIFSNGYNLLPDGKLTAVYNEKHQAFLQKNPHERHDDLFLNYPKPLLLQSVIFDAALLSEVGFWDKDVMLDDYAMFIKIFRENYHCDIDYSYLSDNFIVYYRKHEANANANVCRQYQMISQLFRKMAPGKLINKALATRLSFYLLIAMKRADFKSFLALLKGERLAVIFLALPYMFLQAINKLTGR